VLATGATTPSLRLEVRDDGGVCGVELSSERARRWLSDFTRLPTERWTMRLAHDLATELRVDGGAARFELNCRELRMTRLEVKSGASDVRVVPPQTPGTTIAMFDLGAASLEINVPEAVAAHIRADIGLASLTVDESRFARMSSREFQSREWATASQRVEITIKAGASGIRITQRSSGAMRPS